VPHGNPSTAAPASDPAPSTVSGQSSPAPHTVPPVIQAHADLVADATGPGGATVSYTLPSATDAVDGTVSVNCAPASGHGLALGHTTVHCTASDAAHNVAHSSFDVLVHDTTPPAIQTHANFTAEAFGPGGATVTYGVHCERRRRWVGIRDVRPGLRNRFRIRPYDGDLLERMMRPADSVDGSVSVTCAPASGAAFGIGHTTVTCTA
jgi:hypothetical protein